MLIKYEEWIKSNPKKHNFYSVFPIWMDPERSDIYNIIVWKERVFSNPLWWFNKTPLEVGVVTYQRFNYNTLISNTLHFLGNHPCL